MDLKTYEGESLNILNPGLLNRNAGPDFSNAKIRMGDTLWGGNVEIHLKSSDWLKHNHQLDPAYENVVLHVVFEHDADVRRIDGTLLPVLELKHRIQPELIEKYSSLFLNLNEFPCAGHIQKVDRLIVDSCLSRTLVERFEQKKDMVLDVLKMLNGDWDETFYRFLAKNFGFNVNALPFELMASAVPQKIFARHKTNSMQIDAMIFGAAGFLKGKQDEAYPKALKKEFIFLQKKYGIVEIDVSLWKFMRMRPQNFPTMRLAQFAALIYKSDRLFSKIIAIENVHELTSLFEELPVNDYWNTHYHFKKAASNVSGQSH